KTDIGNQRVGQISAERQKSTVSEVDHSAEVEDQRQAKRHQGIERADDQAVEDVKKDNLAHALCFAAGAIIGDTGEQSPLPSHAGQVGQVILQPLSSTE